MKMIVLIFSVLSRRIEHENKHLVLQLNKNLDVCYFTEVPNLNKKLDKYLQKLHTLITRDSHFPRKEFHILYDDFL